MITFLVTLFIIRGLLKLDISAWWVAIVYNSIFFMSAIVTGARIEFSDLIEYAAVTPQVSEIYDRMGPVNMQPLVWGTVASFLLYFGFMLWIQRYFTAEYKNPEGILPDGIEPDSEQYEPDDEAEEDKSRIDKID